VPLSVVSYRGSRLTHSLTRALCWNSALITTAPDDTYLNTFWLDYDAKNNIAYFLTGDENSLYDLVVVVRSET